MDFDLKPFLLSLLVVLGIMFCAVCAMLYINHKNSVPKTVKWAVSLNPTEDERVAAKSRPRPQYEASEEELAEFRMRLERKAWEAAKAREEEAAKREGREPVQIIAGSDIPAILKYYEDQDAAKKSLEAISQEASQAAAETTSETTAETSSEAKVEVPADPAAVPAPAVCSSHADTSSVENFTKSMGGSAWTFSIASMGSARIEFFEDGGYLASSGLIGKWTASAANTIVMDDGDGVHHFTLTVSADGMRFTGQRNDNLEVTGELICE